MNVKYTEAVPWMAKHARNPWPKKVVWVQDDVTYDRFYWLEIPAGMAKAGRTAVATVDGNTISLEGDVANAMTLHLSDELVDLDRPVTIRVDGKEVFSAKVVRTEAVIVDNLRTHPDVTRCGSAVIRLHTE